LELKTRIKLIYIKIDGFLISWLPYAVVSFISSFLNSITVSPMGSALPAAFAKTAAFWSSFFYICTNKVIIKEIKSIIYGKIKEEKINSEGNISNLFYKLFI
jgi:hypothetical protein